MEIEGFRCPVGLLRAWQVLLAPLGHGTRALGPRAALRGLLLRDAGLRPCGRQELHRPQKRSQWLLNGS